jgi:hypothetical protein
MKAKSSIRAIVDGRDLAVLNPGGWFGETWEITFGPGFGSLVVIVEADNESDAIDALVDDEEYGWHLHAEPGFDPDAVAYCGNSGIPCDLDYVAIRKVNAIYTGKSTNFF